jgi:hypothetical protein
MKLRLDEARVSSDSPDAVGRLLVAKFGAASVTRDGGDWIVRAEVESAGARDANRELLGGSSGRPGSAPNGRRVTPSSDFSTTLLRARDRPVGKIEPQRWGRMRSEENPLPPRAQLAMPIGR